MSQIYLPSNVFTKLLKQSLPEALQSKVVFKPAAVIANILDNEDAIGLIPPTDIIKHSELFVSTKAGLSFDAALSNSYIYFKPGEKEIQKVALAGDVSSLESLLVKFLFAELYNVEIELYLHTKATLEFTDNIVVVGDTNFTEEHYERGLSFSEEMIELLSAPFVNYIFASKSDNLLRDFNSRVKGISEQFYNNAESGDLPINCSDSTMKFLKENVNSCVVELEEQDIEGFHQIIRLPYYHRIIEDILEPKLV